MSYVAVFERTAAIGETVTVVLVRSDGAVPSITGEHALGDIRGKALGDIGSHYRARRPGEGRCAITAPGGRTVGMQSIDRQGLCVPDRGGNGGRDG